MSPTEGLSMNVPPVTPCSEQYPRTEIDPDAKATAEFFREIEVKKKVKRDIKEKWKEINKEGTYTTSPNIYYLYLDGILMVNSDVKGYECGPKGYVDFGSFKCKGKVYTSLSPIQAFDNGIPIESIEESK